MSGFIEFYFDFSSNYSYIVHKDIVALADKHGLTVHWKPIALGAIFKNLGHPMPEAGSAKQKYIWHDTMRSAALAGLPYRWPDPFPVNSIPAARGAYWILDTAPEKITDYAATVFTTIFSTSQDISQPDTLRKIVDGLHLDSDAFLTAVQDETYKARLKQETAAAQDKGVFGGPIFFYGNEMFWGADRLAALDAHIAAHKN
ncbi:2-hydroxychromene-2-carboxylate isomerase [Paremcibacter congregatus]|uniref:2-hydroxychromene-2-carboxylate isomerase n=1 Tax=Paremcibacter congregatus TaxID=2043170 RepID=UPI0030EEC0B0|tara:strand:+ start:50 stop:652 length:603 start_codon:yes stop_codon:yes gene_type:complete